MKALVLYALQNDFYWGGMLEHPNAQIIVSKINELIPKYDTVITVRKGHPHEHIIFAANHPWRKPWQVITTPFGSVTLWPFHSIEGTFGAAPISDLELGERNMDIVVGKASNINFRNFFHHPQFEEHLREKKIDTIEFAGFCFTEGIYQTAIHAASIGYKTVILTELVSYLPELEDSYHDAIREATKNQIVH